VDENEIVRLGASRRWSDVVIHAGVARWVEVADDSARDARAQIAQVLHQIDATLAQIHSDKNRLLEVLMFLADLNDAAVLNELWDDWVCVGHPPIRACVQAGLAGGCRVEMVVTAAVATKSLSKNPHPGPLPEGEGVVLG
jgi:enamine deaminase RidA (YjgF/YER057c/UK114 family)